MAIRKRVRGDEHAVYQNEGYSFVPGISETATDLGRFLCGTKREFTRGVLNTVDDAKPTHDLDDGESLVDTRIEVMSRTAVCPVARHPAVRVAFSRFEENSSEQTGCSSLSSLYRLA